MPIWTLFSQYCGTLNAHKYPIFESITNCTITIYRQRVVNIIKICKFIIKMGHFPSRTFSFPPSSKLSWECAPWFTLKFKGCQTLIILVKRTSFHALQPLRHGHPQEITRASLKNIGKLINCMELVAFGVMNEKADEKLNSWLQFPSSSPPVFCLFSMTMLIKPMIWHKT